MRTDSAMRVFFDASRLLSRGDIQPSGIDRVDRAYLTALDAADGIDLQLVRFGTFGASALSPSEQRALLDRVAQAARLAPRPTPDAAASGHFQALRAWLRAPAGTARPNLVAPQKPRSLRATLSASRAWLRPRVKLARGRPSIYLNTSHGGMYRRSVAAWLGRQRIGGVFFVHDLIPIEYPQFNRAREPARHAARLGTVSRHGKQVLVNSSATAGALTAYLEARAARLPPITTVQLGVDPRFAQVTRGESLAPSVPYFVMLCTIEPRKNHRLLLDVWREWIARSGEHAARLVIVGRRGWENEAVFDELDNDARLRAHVVECNHLDDAHLAALLRDTRAVLAPSFAEGFGLPVAEALSAGTPVIASDIAAHREVGGDWVEYLSPHDGAAWQQRLETYAAQEARERDERAQRLCDYRAPTWESHFQCVFPLLERAGLQ